MREVPLPVWCMTLAALSLAYFSAQSFVMVSGYIHNAVKAILWIPAGVWAGVLLLGAIRPINILIISMFGARRPTSAERDYLYPLWLDAIHVVDVKRNRYTLLITEHDRLPLDYDLGPYVVTIDRKEVIQLTPDELSAVIVQRISRQKIMLSPLLGVCLWALAPLALWLGLSVLALTVLRGIYRVAFGAVRGAGPPPRDSNFAAGCLLLVIAVGIAAFFAFIAVGAFAILFLIEASLGAVIVTSLAKWAEKFADDNAANYGYGTNLVSAIQRLGPELVSASGWRSFANTRVMPQERISRIERSLSTARAQDH